MLRFLSYLAFISIFIIPSYALAVPDILSYSGYVEDSNQAPMTGSETIILSIYTTPTSGTAEWTETITITFDGGYFAITLGEETSLDTDLFDGQELYLGIKIGDLDELAPRTKITSVAYSIRAGVTDTVVNSSGETVVDEDGNWLGEDIDSIDETALETYLEDNNYVTQTQLETSVATNQLEVNGDAIITGYTALGSTGTAGLDVDGDLLVTGYTAVDGLGVTGDLDVAGHTVLNTVETAGLDVDGDLLVTGYTAVDGLGVSGDLDIGTGDAPTNLAVSGDSVLEGAVDVGGYATFYDGVEVAGGLKVGNEDTCDENNAGIIRWSGTNFEGCNGSTWVKLDSENSNYFGQPVVAVNMPDSRSSSTSWTDVTAREVTFTKQETGSVLRVTYHDTIGINMSSSTTSCKWRLTMDDSVIGREQWHHSSASSGWRTKSGSFKWFLPDVPDGSHTFKLQVKKEGGASECLNGWTEGEQENFFMVQEFPAPTDPSAKYAVARNMPDVRTSSGSWTNVGSREVTYTKQAENSVLRVTYHDSLGFQMTGTHNDSCKWRLTMDNSAVGGHQSHHSSTTSGWRIWSGSFDWFLPSVSAGTHTFIIQSIQYNGASQCLNGWDNGSQENFFLVEEIDPPSASAKYAVARNMPDIRVNSTSWTNVASREVTYDKQNENSQLRVTYFDSLGTSMTSQNTACKWRLTMDNNAVGKEQWHHSGAATGWRIWSGPFEWLLSSIPAGSHTFRIQAMMGGGTNECLNGWNNGSQENFFIVQEY